MSDSTEMPGQPKATCPNCGAPIPDGAPDNLCPACMLVGGMAPDLAELEETVVDANAPLPGETVGRYKLLQKIGEGGFGVVYMAEQTEPVKRCVALKVIKAGMDSTEIIVRFEAERQSLALMSHPNIAHVYDAGTTENGRPYFVMELIKGVPITQYCDEGNLDTNARLELFITVCSAVQHAHQKGIIHRDLKPSNILISSHDGMPVVKVIDFGIAKAISTERTDESVLTELGRMIGPGTPQYMAPEQAQPNAFDVDTRSDIYSLGVVLYELLTGTTPLDGEKLYSATCEEMQRMICEIIPEKPSTCLKAGIRAQPKNQIPIAKSKFPNDLDWIVMRALEKERARRYETANGLALDIGRYLRDEPTAAVPPSARYRFAKFVRRNRRQVLIGTLAGAALLAALAISGAVWLDALLSKRENLNENIDRAYLTAWLIHLQLEDLKDEVEGVVGDPDLRPLLEKFKSTGETEFLEEFLNRQREVVNSSGTKWMGERDPINSLSLFDARGILIARAPKMPSIYGEDFSNRDHFKGAMEMGIGSRPHTSLVYDSRTDEEPKDKDKFGISRRIGGVGETPFVIMASVTTAPTAILSGFERNTVLIARSDPDNEWRREFPWLIIAHPAFNSDSEAIGIDKLPIKESDVRGHSSAYVDPASSEYPKFSGLWLAGFAQVEGTKFIVIVQTRGQVNNALPVALAVLAAAIACVAFLVWRFIRRSKRVEGASS